MANVWEFSPDSGTTKYDITDLQGRDDIDGINHLDVNLADLKTINTSGTWNNNAYTHNGITYTIDDGSVNVNGTLSSSYAILILASYSIIGDLPIKNGSYTLSGRPKSISGNANLYQRFYNPDGSGTNNDDNGSGVTVNYLRGSNYNIAISVSGGSGKTVTNAVVKPMLTDAKYAGVPYRPYNQQSIQHQINDITGVTGVRNISPFDPYIATTSGVQSSNIGNGTVRYTTPTAATANVWFGISQPNSGPNVSMFAHTLKKGSYKLVVNSSQALTSNIQVGLLINGVSLDWVNSGTHNAIPFSLSEDATFYLGVRFSNGATITNIDIQAFIILASDPSDEYVPFAMTNRELTEAIVEHANEPKLIATATANQTWAAQLTTLNTAYLNLTAAQKARAIIGFNGYPNGIFRCVGVHVGNFDLPMGINSTGGTSSGYTVRLSLQKAFALSFINGVYTATDISSSTNSNPLMLYLE